ncbi:MAG TPA: hypothetical protein VKE74_14885, partial [Gemmataceae bacterium]|nr:hypothetical protein [Gemmataceae bacterium]
QPAVNDCRVMAAAAGESAEPEGTDSTFPVKPTAGSDRPAKILSAMALLRTIGPNAAEIARRIGMPRTTLMGCEEFAVAYQGLRRDKADRRDRYRRNHTDPDD